MTANYTVPLASLLCMGTSLLLSLGVPVALAILCGRRRKSAWRAVAVGVICFCGGKSTALFTIAFCAVIIAGSGMAPPAVWTAADITVGVMTILNLYCLYRLRKLIYPPREITSDAKKSQNSASARVGAADPDRIRRRRPSGGGDMI